MRFFTRLPFVLGLCGASLLAQAQIGVSAPPVAGPPIAACTKDQLLKKERCPDGELPFLLGDSPVQDAYNARQFDKLDALFAQWCTGQDRLPDGQWLLKQYGGALRRNFSAWGNWDQDLSVIKRWQAARPDSAAAQFAEASYWYEYAWKARGSGFAGTVSQDGWALFRERLGKAAAALGTPQVAASTCPAPAALQLRVMIDMGAPGEALESVFAAAAKKNPEYHDLYFALARHYEPKWGGSAAKYQRFAEQSAAATRKFEGMGLYARLYWVVDSRGNLPFANDPNTAPSWAKLKAGYEDLVRRYPSSLHNLGKFAGVACRSSDSALYRTLRTQIIGYEEDADFPEDVEICDQRHHWVAP